MPKYIGNKLKKGEVMDVEQGGVQIIKWVDKSPALKITSDPNHTSSLLKTGKIIEMVRKYLNQSV